MTSDTKPFVRLRDDRLVVSDTWLLVGSTWHEISTRTMAETMKLMRATITLRVRIPGLKEWRRSAEMEACSLDCRTMDATSTPESAKATGTKASASPS